MAWQDTLALVLAGTALVLSGATLWRLFGENRPLVVRAVSPRTLPATCYRCGSHDHQSCTKPTESPFCFAFTESGPKGIPAVCGLDKGHTGPHDWFS